MKVSVNARSRALLCLMLLLTSIVTSLAQFDTTHAAQITSRKLTLGSSAISANNTYTFNFTVPTTGTAIKSASFQICDAATGTCNLPTGAGTGSATLASQPTGLGAAAGWTSGTTSGNLKVVNASNATNPSGSQAVVFNTVTNTSTTNSTFYVRITTYSDSAYTTPIDTGVVAASTATTITVNGYMPESLVFCTGATITLTGGAGTPPDCTTATAGTITFGTNFSSTATATTTSQMGASTNAATGYAITVVGTTLTSGSNFIPAQGTSAATTASTIGTSVWGINLLAASFSPTSTGATLQANPTAAYATAGSMALDLTGATAIAKSDALSPGTSAPTLIQRYTINYYANVSGIQPAGSYQATLNYICTPTF